MEIKGKIYFKNEPFMAVVEGRGDNPVKCTPIVYDGRDPSSAFGNECGAGIIFEDGKKYSWGLWQPRDLITAWRATEVLRRLNVIKKHDFCAAYYTGRRRVSNNDREKYVEPIIAKIGRQAHREIMSMPIPDEIIRAILDNQGQDFSPSGWPITDEIAAGTIKWQEAFSRVGIKHPDEVKAEEWANKKTIARFKRLIDSYTNSRIQTCFAGLPFPEGDLLELVKKDAGKIHSDSLLVALAGAKSGLFLSDSAQWLVSLAVGKPRFFSRRHSHSAAVSELNKMVEQSLSRLLEEFFPAVKASSATTSAQ